MSPNSSTTTEALREQGHPLRRPWRRYVLWGLVLCLTLLAGAMLGGLWTRRMLLSPGLQQVAYRPVAAGSALVGPAPQDAGAAGAPSADDHRSGQVLLVDVLDQEGHSLAGVLVTAQPADDRGLPALPQGQLEPVGELGVLHGRLPLPADVPRSSAAQALAAAAAGGTGVKTDAHGTVRFANLAPGLVLVAAGRDGLVASAEVRLQEVPSDTAGRGESLRVVLRLAPAPVGPIPQDPDVPADAISAAGIPAGTVSGVVIDERTLYLPGARIEAQSGRLRRTATSDARGQFTLLSLPIGQAGLSLRVEHAGFAPLLSAYHAEDPALREQLRLQLLPGGGIEGEVRERRHGPLPGKLTLTLRSGEVTIPVAVGRDGRFRQTGLPGGEIQLTLVAPGHVQVKQKLQVPTADHPDSVTVHDVVLELEAGGAVVGLVRDTDGPVAGAEVQAADERGAEVARGTTSTRGEFRLGPLSAGPVTVTVSSKGAQGREKVEVPVGGEARVELELR